MRGARRCGAKSSLLRGAAAQQVTAGDKQEIT